jgi:hypothetical protein
MGAIVLCQTSVVKSALLHACKGAKSVFLRYGNGDEKVMLGFQKGK